MLITGLRNKKTGEVIYSRAHHDFHWDSKEEIAIDGGFEYKRTCWKDGADFEIVRFELNVTKNELYDDWNTNQNKYGWITAQQIVDRNIDIEVLNSI